MNRIWNKIKKLNIKIVRIIQKNLIAFFLFVIYYVIFGLTRFLILFFKPKMLAVRMPMRSNWKISNAISGNLEDYYNQS